MLCNTAKSRVVCVREKVSEQVILNLDELWQQIVQIIRWKLLQLIYGLVANIRVRITATCTVRFCNTTTTI